VGEDCTAGEADIVETAPGFEGDAVGVVGVDTAEGVDFAEGVDTEEGVGTAVGVATAKFSPLTPVIEKLPTDCNALLMELAKAPALILPSEFKAALTLTPAGMATV